MRSFFYYLLTHDNTGWLFLEGFINLWGGGENKVGLEQVYVRQGFFHYEPRWSPIRKLVSAAVTLRE